jgi:glycosyltransferase involved in cell wall biosynthesis
LSVDERFTLSVVVPAFNEETVLPELHRRLTAVLTTLDAAWEIV